MVREFQIWSHNLSRITFDPLLANKRSKTGKIPISLVFDRFWLKEGIKCYPIEILRSDLESNKKVDKMIICANFCFSKPKTSPNILTRFDTNQHQRLSDVDWYRNAVEY